MLVYALEHYSGIIPAVYTVFIEINTWISFILLQPG
jgi:hypothetical protein